MGAYPREITSEYKRAQVYKKEVPQSALSEFYIWRNNQPPARRMA